MTQHFLLSAKARTLSLKAIFQAGEEKAYKTFCEMRWPTTNGEAVCPRCGCCETYGISSRRRFKCVACHHQFSVTSGTIFASRKMTFVDLLAAVCITMHPAVTFISMRLKPLGWKIIAAKATALLLPALPGLLWPIRLAVIGLVTGSEPNLGSLEADSMQAYGVILLRRVRRALQYRLDF